MRTLIPLCAVALVACAKETRTQWQAARAPGAGSRAALEALAATGSLDETTVLAAAATVVREGGMLPAASALRCVREEARERVREACLVAWSAGGEESAEIYTFLKNQLPSASRTVALAAARREGFVKTLDAGEIGILLYRIPEPAWARALALRTWVLAHPVPPHLVDSLWGALGLPANPDPLSLGAAATIAQRAGGNPLRLLRESYCPSQLTGIALTRCYRLASALVDPRSGSFTPVFPFPPRQSPAWPVFAVSFPERARLLETQL